MLKPSPQELHQVQSDPGDPVVRRKELSQQDATVSFGQEWPAAKYTEVLDVVNYYKPNPKTQLYLPENSFYNSNGKVRPHMGGESTYRGNSMSNRNRNVNTHTNNLETRHDVHSVDSDNDTVVPEARTKGLFEVPFDVYSMPRLIATFKGFSKIVTPRAIKLLTFIETEEGKLVCKVDKNALRILQKQVGDVNVVPVSFTGDPKSGKSFLASLLVGKDNASFHVSESYIDPNNTLTNGTVWTYMAVYQEKNAYVFLDFEGFEHCDESKVKMLLFAFAASSLVLCNVKYSLMNGINNAVKAMVDLTKKQKRNLAVEDEEALDQEENEFLEMLKVRGTRLMSTSYDTQNFNELTRNPDYPDELERRELWNAPIVQFVFRDCSGFVKCIDDRIFTPETLVEQGLFDNYLDLFSTAERDPNFRNEMLDSFEVFTNRKYISLPHPTLSTHPYSDNDYGEEEGLNITEFFTRLLTSEKNDLRRLARLGYDELTLNTNLSSMFYEKLDQIKSLLYHDTLNYAMAHSQLNGRMFGEYLKKLVTQFNATNSFTVDDLNDLLCEVYLGENTNVLKEALLQFLRQVRAKVAPKLPMDSKTLLNMVFSAKFACINYFETNAFGTPEEYGRQLDELSDTIEQLIRKLEEKNKALMTAQMANYVEKKEADIKMAILKDGYTVEDLDEDLSKLKKSLNARFTDSELVLKVLGRTSQNLVRVFNDTHPETFLHNLSYSKSSSIEETFETLNTDITSMTANLHLVRRVESRPVHPGEDVGTSPPQQASLDTVDESDKLNWGPDNALDIEEDEDFEFDGDFEQVEGDGKYEEGLDEQDYDGDDEQDEQEQGYEEDESAETADYEDEEDENAEFEEELATFELEQDESVETDEGSEANDEEDQYEMEMDEDEESARFQWVHGESGGTTSFKDSMVVSQNSEEMYEEGETPEEREDEVVEVVEDDFVQESLESGREKKSVLREIFEKSAHTFAKARGPKHAAK